MTVFTGSGVALVTPFIENTGVIDWKAFEDLIQFHLDHQTDALIITGTTGESSTLTDEEQIQLIKFAVDKVQGRVPVIGGTGINDTQHTIRLSVQAQEAGIDALLIVTPYYNKASRRGIIQHFTQIAEAVDIPIILYHVPGRTGMTFAPETVAELAKIDNIVALKDATGDLDYTKSILDLVGEDFAIYSGNDDLTHEIMKLGGKGTISVTANVMPEEIHQLCQLNLDGHVLEAEHLNGTLDPINVALFKEVNPIPVKYVVSKLGWCSLEYRLPLCPPEEEVQEILDEYVDKLMDKYGKR